MQKGDTERQCKHPESLENTRRKVYPQQTTPLELQTKTETLFSSKRS
jgi:hypothetical protein